MEYETGTAILQDCLVNDNMAKVCILLIAV